MEKSLLTEVKAILKSLVVSCPEKITVDRLNRDYRDVEGQYIPYRQFGYSNLEQFLHSLPDTLRVFGSGPTAMVCFVPNEKSDHIHDMIIKQKKPKSRTRTRSKVTSSKNNCFQRSNFNNNNQTRVRMGAQQLSPYQTVNRNHMTRKIQVTNVPRSAHRVNTSAPPILSNQVLYNLPPPNGILLNPQQYLNYQLNPIISRIQNGIIRPVSNQTQTYETQLSILMKNQCNVLNPPPPLPRQENRSVKFSPENQTKKVYQEKPVQIEQSIEKLEECVQIEKSSTRYPISSDEVKRPSTKESLPVKLSDEVESLLSMPKLSRVKNPIEQQENVQNNNSESVSKSLPSKGFFDDSAEIVETESDEAVPSFAARNNVFRLDFPEHTVSYGNKLPPYKLPEEVKVGSFIRIFISEIHSPFRFWFHIHKEKDELGLLMYQIERYYSALDSEDLRIPVMCLTPGLVCAACYNGLWHRAEIVAPPVNKNIKVSFMDYGTVTEVEIENIKFLQSFFAQLPAQALRGCLSHIKPHNFHWSYEATTYFLKLVEELMLYGEITEIDRKKNVLYMVLCDTNGDEVVQINKSLVEKRYACYNEEWKTEKIEKNNGKRVRHPREDFPT